MKLIDKLKTVLFEDDEEEQKEEVKKEEPIAKKIDIKTESEIEEIKEEVPSIKREEKPKKPIIFDDEDFLMETNTYTNIQNIPREPKREEKPVPKKEERILYGGYDKEYGKSKEKFKPSQVLSPVYGVVNIQSKTTFSSTNNTSSYESIYKEEKTIIDIDSIRKKAYGDTLKQETREDLVVDIRDDNTVAVDKITLGDAEEYFNDLGLEYNVDYEDKEKNKQHTRTKKNKDLTEMVDEEIKENKKIKKELEEKENRDDIEEKNLYDLIDMMYDNRE